MLYDGRTFDEWRSKWRYELKTEKRIEAIKALAAFGRAGKGREAAEAILDVAGEYDFTNWSDDGAGDLKREIIGLMTSKKAVYLSAQTWFPALMDRYRAEPQKWTGVADSLIGMLRTDDEAIQATLLEFARDAKSPLQKSALAALAAPHEAERVRLLDAMLRGDDADEATFALYQLVTPAKMRALGHGAPGSEFVNVDAIYVGLSSPLPSVQRIARSFFRGVNSKQRDELRERALAHAEQADGDELLALLRAVAAAGPLDGSGGEARAQALQLGERLQAIAKGTDDQRVKAAAIFAIAGGGQATQERHQVARSLLAPHVPDAKPDELDAMIDAEQEAVFGPIPPGGKGGGFF